MKCEAVMYGRSDHGEGPEWHFKRHNSPPIPCNSLTPIIWQSKHIWTRFALLTYEWAEGWAARYSGGDGWDGGAAHGSLALPRPGRPCIWQRQQLKSCHKSSDCRCLDLLESPRRTPPVTWAGSAYYTRSPPPTTSVSVDSPSSLDSFSPPGYHLFLSDPSFFPAMESSWPSVELMLAQQSHNVNCGVKSTVWWWKFLPANTKRRTNVC